MLVNGRIFSSDETFGSAVLSAKNEKRRETMNYTSTKYEDKFDDFGYFSPNSVTGATANGNIINGDDDEFWNNIDTSNPEPTGSFGFNGISAFGGIDFTKLAEEEDAEFEASPVRQEEEVPSLYNFFEDISDSKDEDVFEEFEFAPPPVPVCEYRPDPEPTLKTSSAALAASSAKSPKETQPKRASSDKQNSNGTDFKEGFYKGNSVKSIAVTVAIFAALIGLFIVSVVVSLSSALGNGTVYDGVFLNGKNLGGMTKDEVAAYVQKTYVDPILGANINVTLGETNNTYTLDNFVKCPDSEAIAEQAYSVARTGSVFSRVKQIENLKEKNYSLPIAYDIVSDKLEDVISSATDISFSEPVDPTYELRSDVVVFTAGKHGTNIDKEKFMSELYAALNEFKDGIVQLGENDAAVLSDIDIAIDTTRVEFKMLSAQEIYTELYIAPVSAYYYKTSSGTVSVSEHSVGRSVDLSELTALTDRINNGEEIPYASIEYEYVSPEKNSDALRGRLYETTAAEVTTVNESDLYSDVDWIGKDNRNTNMELLAKNFGTVELLSGETVNFLSEVGSVTSGKGYVAAYENLIDDGSSYIVGGGISQVATALYTAAMKCNLSTAEHYNSCYMPTYGVTGFDAFVSSTEGKNLVIKNTRSYPIKITMSYYDGVVTVKILGAYEGCENGTLSVADTVTSPAENGTTYTFTIGRSFGGPSSSLGTVSYVKYGETYTGEIPEETMNPHASENPGDTSAENTSATPEVNSSEEPTAVPSGTANPSVSPEVPTEEPTVSPETATPAAPDETSTPDIPAEVPA